ncbi:helix-turn-helix transcriptional regulator [Streptomyces sp. NPDC047046]|uniref:helix-turn-helix domain-containing protein n=1 Tax=Streptomyces sp. NPDC047046 TaxID=3155378 RepID=UPI00340C222F
MTAETDAPDAASSLLAFFGTELLRVRSERGMSQGKLAKAAYTTQAMISYVENAERVPSPELAQNLDTALETAGLHPALPAGNPIRLPDMVPAVHRVGA